MSYASLLETTCTIERATATPQPDGSVSVAWSPIASGVPCAFRVDEVETEAHPEGAPLAARATLHLPGGTDIRPAVGETGADRVLVEGVYWHAESVRPVRIRGRSVLAVGLRSF
jgi:hypothetical protein